MKAFFHDLITDERRSVKGHVLRPFLLSGAWFFSLCVRFRKTLYRHGILKSYKLPRTVISIGNITWGGTGKTPLAEELLRFMCSKGLRPALLTRGYGSDEDRLLRACVPQALIISGKDRLSNALKSLKQDDADIFILDDGFQHFRIKRDLDIVVINVRCAFGNEKLMPAGILREPLEALKRADMVVVTKSDLVPLSLLLDIESRIKNISPNVSVFRGRHAPKHFFKGNGHIVPLEYVKGRRLTCVSALADNQSFEQTVRVLGAKIARGFFYLDHYRYCLKDLRFIIDTSKSLNVNTIVTTEKDWIKLEPLTKTLSYKDMEFIVLKIKLEVYDYEIFNRRLSSVLPG